MKRDKITLNEELSRMRHLLKAKSGQKMTITEINRTYLSERLVKPGEADTEANPDKPNPAPPTNQSHSVNSNSSSRTGDYKGFYAFDDGNGRIRISTIRDPERLLFARGTPATITFNDPNMATQANAIISPTNPTQQGNPLSTFYKTIETLITDRPFQSTTTPRGLMQNNQKLNAAGNRTVMGQYTNSVIGPIVNVLTAPPFNAQIPNPIPTNFNWGQFWNNLHTNVIVPGGQNTVAQLRIASSNALRGLSAFKRFLANPGAVLNDSGATGPITGYMPPQKFAGTFADTGGALNDLDQSAAETGVNDVIDISIAFTCKDFGGGLNKDRAVNATYAMCNVFYGLIKGGRTSGGGASGTMSTDPIVIPSLDELYRAKEVTDITTGWDKLAEWRSSVQLVGIDIKIQSAYPNLITFVPNTVRRGTQFVTQVKG